MAIKITGSAQNYRVGRVSGDTPIFLGLNNVTVKEFNGSEDDNGSKSYSIATPINLDQATIF